MGRYAHAAASSCLIAVVLLMTSCGSSSSAPPPSPTALSLGTVPPATAFTAALVTDVGGLYDRSFNELTWKGLQAAQKSFGIKIANKQSKTEPRYAPALTSFANRKPALVIAVGYSMSRAVYDVAQKYPQQRFAMVDARPVDPTGSEVSLPNVENILFKEEESGYLAGVMAGLVEKQRIGKATHNTIGYLGGKQIPGVEHYLAGYVAGAKSVDPSIHVIGRYARTFVNARLGHSIGIKQIGRGADILFQVAAQTGSGYLSAAQEKGVYGIGADIDESFLGNFVLTSALKRVNIAVRKVIQSTLNGAFHAGDQRFDSKSGATGISTPSVVVPATISSQFRAVRLRLQRGAIVPPQSVPAR